MNTTASNQPYRIAVRFGDAILQAGHTAVPNLALNHYAELGVSHAEMMFTIHIWQYWWTERDPYPALGTIAAKMGVSTRQARNYARSLRQKGFLEVQERHIPGLGQVTSEYNFAPLIEAITELARAGQPAPRNESSWEGRKDPSSLPRKPVSREKDIKQEDSSSIGSQADADGGRSRPTGHRPPAPPGRQATGTVERAGDVLKRRPPTAPDSQEAATASKAIAAHLAELRQEFGDQAQARSSERRGLNLYRRSGSDLASFIGRLYQARSLTREQCNAPAGGARPRRPMAYFFAVLEQLLGLEAASTKAA